MGLMPDIRDAPEIEQALSIPLQPAHGLVLGPIKVMEPSTDPLFRRPEAEAQPAAPAADAADPDVTHRSQADPAGPSARPASVPAKLSKPGLLHKVQSAPARHPPAAPRPQPPAEAPPPDWLHRTQFDPVPGHSPAMRPEGAPPPADLLHHILFDPASGGFVDRLPANDRLVNGGV
jgi:hypothetical protein